MEPRRRTRNFAYKQGSKNVANYGERVRVKLSLFSVSLYTQFEEKNCERCTKRISITFAFFFLAT